MEGEITQEGDGILDEVEKSVEEEEEQQQQEDGNNNNNDENEDALKHCADIEQTHHRTTTETTEETNSYSINKTEIELVSQDLHQEGEEVSLSQNDGLEMPSSVIVVHHLDDEVPSVTNASLPVRDKYKVAYILFFLLGVGTLVPFNAFLSAIDYFEVTYPTVEPSVIIPAAYMYSNLLAFLPTIKYGTNSSFMWRTIIGFIIYVVILFLVPVIGEFSNLISNTKESTEVWFYAIIVLVFFSGCTDSFVQAAIYGLAAFFPFENIQAILSGTGMAGLFISLLRLLTKVVFDDTEKGTRISGDIFFSISACYMLACIGFYFMLRRNAYVKYVLYDAGVKKPPEQNLDAEIASAFPVKHEQLQKQELDEKELDLAIVQNQKPSFIILLRKLWLPIFIVIYTYVISLTVFPGLISAIKPEMGSISDSTYYVLLISLFNIFDFVGKSFPRFYKVSLRWLLGVSLIRTLFIPLFLFSVKPHLIQSDVVTIGGVIICAFTNGFSVTIGMAEGPQWAEPHEKEAAGVVMIFSTVFGLALGSTLAFSFLPIIGDASS